MTGLLAVGIGGFLGAITRYLLSGWLAVRFAENFDSQFPVGTLFVNVTGSFLLALFVVWVSHQVNLAQEVRLVVATGFFGAYTTFSTYATESVALLQQGLWSGVGNILLTNGLCLIAVLLGVWLGTQWWTA